MKRRCNEPVRLAFGVELIPVELLHSFGAPTASVLPSSLSETLEPNLAKSALFAGFENQ